MNMAFWQGKKVFLTGHTGFKGSWLALWLRQLGAETTGYALSPPTEPSLYVLARVENDIASIQGDVRDAESLTRAIRRSRPDIVIHMAAQSLVRASYEQPAETFATNVMGTVNVLEAVRQCDAVRVVLNVTSDKCYENREWDRGYCETDRMGGHDPYSSSKGCAELVASAYRRSFFSSENGPFLASCRAGNVIGGGDWAIDRLIPDMIRAFIENRPVHIRNPQAIRPWQHVLEPLSGYLTVAERLWKGDIRDAEGWNFGPAEEDARPVGWLVETMAKKIVECGRPKTQWRLDDRLHAHEAKTLKLDWTQARERLGWRPTLDLETALSWTAQWYCAYGEKADMRQWTLDELTRYQQRLLGNTAEKSLV